MGSGQRTKDKGRRGRLTLSLVLWGMVLWMAAGQVWASAVLTSGDPLVPAEDQMLIFYDPATRQEIILFNPSVRFHGDTLTWLVPLPGEAKIEGVNRQFFRRLNDYVAPTTQIQTHTRWQAGSLVWSLVRKLFTPSTPSPDTIPLSAPPGKVLVARREAALRFLAAPSEPAEKLTEAVKDALAQPNYEMPANLLEWTKPYREHKFWWMVIAAKTDKTETEPQIDEQVSMPPLRATFTTDKPYIPMVMPMVEDPAGWRTSYTFRYFVAMPGRAEVMVGDRPFFTAGDIPFADRISQEDWKNKILASTPPEIPITNDLFLTTFVHSEPKRPAVVQDGTILPATSQSTLRPPVRVEIKEKIMAVPVEAFVLFLGGIVLVIREKRLKGSKV